MSFLVGIMLWYCDKNQGWHAMLMGGTVLALIVYTVVITVSMLRSLHQKESFKEEIKKVAEVKRAVESC